MSTWHTLIAYSFGFLITPVIVNGDFFRKVFLPRLSYTLCLNKITTDAVAVNVGFVTLYIYVALGLTIDLMRSLLSPGRPTLSASLVRLERAHRDATHIFPAFATSALITWANTNRFDTLGSGFVALQAILVVLMPLVHFTESHGIWNIVYRCSLFWTLIYGIMPLEATFAMNQMAQAFVLPQQGIYNVEWML